MSSSPTNLNDVRSLKEELSLGTPDAVFVTKLLKCIDRVADLIDEHRDNINELTETVESIAEVLEEVAYRIDELERT